MEANHTVTIKSFVRREASGRVGSLDKMALSADARAQSSTNVKLNYGFANVASRHV
jgi:hypothetical protein